MLLARRGAALALTSTAASLSTARASMAPVVPLPTTAALAEAPLKPLLASSSAVTQGKELWREQPVVILAVRRPGCQLCRAEVSGLQGIKAQLDAAGVRLVAVLHEEREEQVAEFKADFWPGELFLDADKEVFKAVGGGQVRRGSLLAFMNPFSRIWCARRARALVRSQPRCSHRLRAGRMSRTPTAWWRRATWWVTGSPSAACSSCAAADACSTRSRRAKVAHRLLRRYRRRCHGLSAYCFTGGDVWRPRASGGRA